MEDEPDIREQIFHNTVRENIVSTSVLRISRNRVRRFKKHRSYLQIFLLLFLLLYVSSYAIIGQFRRRDAEDYITEDNDDVTVYQIR